MLIYLQATTRIDIEMVVHPTLVTKPLLYKEFKGEPRINIWNYWQAAGMLIYLQATTRMDIEMVVHQCARFSNKPMLAHE